LKKPLAAGARSLFNGTNVLEVYVQPNAGHALNFATNATDAFGVITEFFFTGPGRTDSHRHLPGRPAILGCLFPSESVPELSQDRRAHTLP